jgi:sec-independent protein translocase protein TatC
MPRPKDDDLFAESTMTFGEHLDELRKCLWRAFLGLMLGFIVGLYFGTDVMVFIQKPVEAALQRYYTEESRNRLREAAKEESSDPEKIKEIQERSDKLIDKNRMLGEVAYLDPVEEDLSGGSEKPSRAEETRESRESRRHDSTETLAPSKGRLAHPH